MKNILLGILSVIVLTVHSGIAHADAVLTPELKGSLFLVFASNPENARYNCNISYTLSYQQYGEDGSQHYQNTTTVEPNASGDVVLHHPTNWAASTLGYSDFNYSCFKATTTTPSSQKLPGGTYSESCHGCSMNGSVLSCRCDGKDTSLNVSSCGDGRNLICNNNGRLSCPGPC